MDHQKYQTAVEAYKKGDRAQARRLLLEIVAEDPASADAWYGLALSADNDLDKRSYIEKLLQFQPDHARARQLLDKMLSSEAQSPASGGNKTQVDVKNTIEGRMSQQKMPSMLWTNLLLAVVALLLLILIGTTVWSNLNRPQPAAPQPIDIRITQVAPAEAKATPQPVKVINTTWEYKSVLLSDFMFGGFMGSNAKTLSKSSTAIEDGNTEFMKYLNSLGKDGWELVGFIGDPGGVNAALLFKRPLKP